MLAIEINLEADAWVWVMQWLWGGRCCIYFVQSYAYIDKTFKVLNVDFVSGCCFLILGFPLTDLCIISHLFTAVAYLVSSLTFAVVWYSPSTVLAYLYGPLLVTCVGLGGCVMVLWMWMWCCCFDVASSVCLCVNWCSVLLFMNLTYHFTISIDFATAMTLLRSMSFWIWWFAASLRWCARWQQVWWSCHCRSCQTHNLWQQCIIGWSICHGIHISNSNSRQHSKFSSHCFTMLFCYLLHLWSCPFEILECRHVSLWVCWPWQCCDLR